jgi:putative DNA primase/helicase
MQTENNNQEPQGTPDTTGSSNLLPVIIEPQVGSDNDNTVDAQSADGVSHHEILRLLLSQIAPVNLREIIGLPVEEEMKERHYQFAVVKVLRLVAMMNNWHMRNLNDYVYVYNGEYWKQFNKVEIRKFLSDAAIRMGMPAYEAKPYKFVDGLLKQFLSDAHFTVPEPDEKRVLINLKNKTLEFTAEGWKHKPFDPADFLTYQLPFAYDEGATCPQFDSYLDKVLPDKCSQMVLQEFAGYIFTKMNLEMCLVLTGGGSNGKSVFFNILNALIGPENTLNFSMSSFSQEGNRAKLSNVLLNYSSETGFKLSPEIFKALVSGEPLQARELYCAPFTLRNKVRFIMNCNILPRETENTEAYFRRFKIIPFEVTIKEHERDIHLAGKIIASELPGVFNWLLAGLERLLNQNEFSKCEKADAALAEFKKNADTVQLFLEEYSYRPSATVKEALAHVYCKYEELCKADKLIPIGRSRFSKELEHKGFEKKRTNAGYFVGIEAVATN